MRNSTETCHILEKNIERNRKRLDSCSFTKTSLSIIVTEGKLKSI